MYNQLERCTNMPKLNYRRGCQHTTIYMAGSSGPNRALTSSQHLERSYIFKHCTPEKPRHNFAALILIITRWVLIWLVADRWFCTLKGHIRARMLHDKSHSYSNVHVLEIGACKVQTNRNPGIEGLETYRFSYLPKLSWHWCLPWGYCSRSVTITDLQSLNGIELIWSHWSSV